MLMQLLLMLAAKPLGGSFVILTPLRSTKAGKESERYELSQRRNEGCVDVPPPSPAAATSLFAN